MDTQWGDYCNGFTYEFIYTSGPFEDDPPDLDDYFTINDPADGSEVTVDSRVHDLTWLGTHSFIIRGTNGGSYESIDSDEFTITWIDPCLTTTVIDRTIEDMSTTVKSYVNVTQVYLDFQDQVTVDWGSYYGYDDGIGLCGAKHHYLTDHESGEIQELD